MLLLLGFSRHAIRSTRARLTSMHFFYESVLVPRPFVLRLPTNSKIGCYFFQGHFMKEAIPGGFDRREARGLPEADRAMRPYLISRALI
jgi:hypothetical protein